MFIASFNGGAFLSQKDCGRFLEQAGYGFDERYLQKTPARSTLIRMQKNLIAIYNKVEDVTKASRLTRFIEILGHPEKDEERPRTSARSASRPAPSRPGLLIAHRS